MTSIYEQFLIQHVWPTMIYFHLHVFTASHRAVRCSGNSKDLYSVASWLGSNSCRDIPQYLRSNTGTAYRLHHYYFLPTLHNSLCIDHPTVGRCTVSATDSVVKQTTNIYSKKKHGLQNINEPQLFLMCG